jgi:hypothetical protein
MARIDPGAGLSDDQASEHAGADPIQSRSREDTTVHLDAAIRDLESGEGTARVEPEAVGVRSHAIARQSKRLEEFAVGRGLILRPRPVRCHAFGKEHQVWFGNSFVKKATFPGRFGSSLDGLATPLEYLRRWSLSNEIFGDDARLDGVVRAAEGLRVVISQPFIQAVDAERPHPTGPAIAEFMLENGFQRGRLGRHDIWYLEERNVLAFDAHDGNFIMTTAGVIQIDLVLVEPEEELIPLIRRW